MPSACTRNRSGQSTYRRQALRPPHRWSSQLRVARWPATSRANALSCPLTTRRTVQNAPGSRKTDFLLTDSDCAQSNKLPVTPKSAGREVGSLRVTCGRAQPQTVPASHSQHRDNNPAFGEPRTGCSLYTAGRGHAARTGMAVAWEGSCSGTFLQNTGTVPRTAPPYPTSSQSTHMHTNTRTRAHTTHTTHTRNTHHTQAHITIHTSHTPHTTHVTHTCTHTSHTCTCTHTHPTHAHTPLTHRTRNTPHTHHTHAHTHPACFLGALLLGFLGWRLIREFSPKLECRGLSCSPWEGPRFSHWVLGS